MIITLNEFFFLVLFLLQSHCLLTKTSTFKLIRNNVPLGYESSLIDNTTNQHKSNKLFCLWRCSLRFECKMVIENEHNCFLLNSCLDLDKLSNKNGTNIYLKYSFCFEIYDNSITSSSMIVSQNITQKFSIQNNCLILSLAVLSTTEMVAGCDDNKILVWNLKNQTLIKTLNDHSGTVNSLAVFKNDDFVSSEENKLIIWNSKNWTTRLVWTTLDQINALCTLPNNDLAIGFTDGQIKILDRINGNVKISFIDGNRVMSMVFLKNDYFAIAFINGLIIVRNYINGNIMHQLYDSMINVLTVLPNGDLAAGHQDNTINIWNITSNQIVKVLTNHTSYILSLAVLPNGDLISGSGDNKINIWNLTSGSVIKSFYLNGPVYSLAIINNSYFASGSYPSDLIIWG